MPESNNTFFQTTSIAEFNPIEDKWIIWKERLDIHFSEILCTEDNSKRAILLKSIGSAAYELLRSLCDPVQPIKKDYDDLIKILDEHYTPPIIIYHERKIFHDATRNENESVSMWYARIKKLAFQCKFGAELEVMVKDKFITQLPEKVFIRICEENEKLTLQEALKKALMFETKFAVRNESTDSDVNFMRSSHHNHRKPSNNNNNKSSDKKPHGKKCTRCGWKTHDASTCKFKDATCHTCSKIGHLSSVCRSKENNKKINFINSDSDFLNSICDGNFTNFFVNFSLNSVSEDESRELYRLPVEFKGIKMTLTCDTGAPRTFVSRTFYEKHLSHFSIKECMNPYRAYGGTQIGIIGECIASIAYRGTEKRITVVVTDVEAPPLLGRNFLRAFGFQLTQNDQINSIDSIDISNANTSFIIDSIKREFSALFDGKLGKFNVCEISLPIDEHAKPVFFKPRPIPFAWKSKIETNLRDLVEKGVLEQVDNSAWGSPIVPVPKPDGSLRCCGDYKITINRFLSDFKYPLPLIEEIFASLQGGQLFSKLDMTAAYNQFCLDEKSQLLCTWSTHMGTFKMKRLPFGVKPAAALFQKHMENLLMGINGVVVYQDDITVTGKDFKEHLFNLKAVLKKLSDAGLKLNGNKCVFFQEKISYLGFTIDKHGLHKNKERYESFLNAPIPTNIHELRAFIGMANQYSRFIFGFASKMDPLYQLTQKNVPFVWNQKCQNAYDLIKQDVSSDQVMVHFNPKLPIILTTDACDTSVAGILSHRFPDGLKPVAFISRSLSKSERNYAVIEKEALAIIFSVVKLKQYLLGNFFTLATDHKPLLTIFGENKGIPLMAAARMQRWALILSGFNYKIEFVKGVNNEADNLSRIPQISYIHEHEEVNYINLIENNNALRINFKDISIETRRDPILSKLSEAIEKGIVDKLDHNFDVYKRKSLELTVQYGCVMWGYRTVIPSKLRQYILEELHASHMGIVKTKSLARSYVWWPKIDSDIENLIKQCIPCQELQASPPLAELIPWKPTDSVWSRIHMDYAGPKFGYYYLIVIDSHSKWVEVFKTKTITASFTIIKLRELFSRYGMPETIVTDNGTQFTAFEFENFITNNIDHIFTPPGHPATNGQAENFVKTFKKSFIASVNSAVMNKQSGDLDFIINRILLDYRNTIHCTTAETPAKLFFGRSLRTRFSTLRPPTIKEVIHEKQKQQKRNHKGKRNVNFEQGQKVMIRNYKNPNNPSWSQAIVKRKIGPRSYTCVYAHNNKEIKRHIDQIRDQSNVSANEDTSNESEHNTTANSAISVSGEDGASTSASFVSPQTISNSPNLVHDATQVNSESDADEEDKLDRQGRKLRPQRKAKPARASRLPIIFD